MTSSLVTTERELVILGPLAADDIVAGIPDSRRVVVEDAGHFTWVDAPEQFRDEVGRFLAA